MPSTEMSVWVPAIAALLGALIGSIAPIVVGIIQSQAEHRRERLRLATQLAIEDYKDKIEHARRIAQASGGRRSVGVSPISALLTYHVDVLELLAKGKQIAPADFVALRKRAGAVHDALVQQQEAEK